MWGLIAFTRLLCSLSMKIFKWFERYCWCLRNARNASIQLELILAHGCSWSQRCTCNTCLPSECMWANAFTAAQICICSGKHNIRITWNTLVGPLLLRSGILQMNIFHLSSGPWRHKRSNILLLGCAQACMQCLLTSKCSKGSLQPAAFTPTCI